jgi:hypothetical protein
MSFPFVLQPTPADKPVNFPRVPVRRILIVVVKKRNPNRPIRITVEVDACFEEGKTLCINAQY